MGCYPSPMRTALLFAIVPLFAGLLGCRSGEDVLRERTERIRAHADDPRPETAAEELARLGLVELDDEDEGFDEAGALDPIDDEAALAAARPPDLVDPVAEDLATVEAALAAAEAAETGASVCDAAFQAIAAMAEEVRARDPEAVNPTPPRGSFLHACERLPRDVQQCLLPTYAVGHREECTRATEAAPVADRQRLERLLAGG